MGRQTVKTIDTKTWTLPELAKEIGLQYRTAHLWMERGLLVPSVRQSEGTGHAAIFSDRDLKRAAYLVSLRALGLSMDGLTIISRNPGPLMKELRRWSDFLYRRVGE